MTELLNIYEVAKILRVSYETALMYVKHHNLAIKIGRQYRVPKDKLAAHLSKQPSAPMYLTRRR